MSGQPPLDADEFSAAVTAVTSAFGDPTRRDIYLLIRDTPDGVTASEVAEHFDLHSNVARHHLEKLTAGGYLVVAVGRTDGGARAAGRPSKRYRVLGPRPLAQLPAAARRPARHPARARPCRSLPAGAGRVTRRGGRLRLRPQPREPHGPGRVAAVGEGRARHGRRRAHRARLRGARGVARQGASPSSTTTARSATPRSSSPTSCARSTAA